MPRSIQEEIISLQPRGVITIPKKFRQEIGLKEKSIIKIKKQGNRLIIQPVRTIPYPVRSYTKEEIKEFLKLDQEQSRQLKKKGYLR